MFSYRLGLDVGANSLGWSVLELDKQDEPCAVKDAGARIFSDGRVEKSKATLKANRRAARSARRRHDRYKQRRTFLLAELTKAGLFPESQGERRELQKKDPLDLRAKALKEKLEPYEIGRALFHLNQRRGFQSNRKDRSKETTSGMVSNSVTALLRAMQLMEEGYSTEKFKALPKEAKKEAREKEQQQKKDALDKLWGQNALTFGSFLWERRKEKKTTRARPNSDSKIYDCYPTREMLKHEFEAIWKAQAGHHRELLTEPWHDRLRTVIFTQRPLKPPKVGKCMYLPDEDRMFRAMPSFQRYRIYQEVNNMEWTTSRGRNRLIDHPEARDEIVAMLERPGTQKGNVTFSKMKNVLQKRKLATNDCQFNFETPKRNGFDGNLTSNLMQDESRVGKQWHTWSLEKQDSFIEVILDGTPEQKQRRAENERRGLRVIRDGTHDDEEVQDYLRHTYNLSGASAEQCMSAYFVQGTASLSKKAAAVLIEKMRDDRLIQPDAVREAKDKGVFPCDEEVTRKDQLPYYGKAFLDGRHIIPGDQLPADKKKGNDLKYYGGVTNPTVHIALNQIRHVVNELIARYGCPASIAIELGRDLPAGQEGRAEINKAQKDNQDNNERLDNRLREQGQSTTPDNRLRLQLWEELDKDPNGRCCPFSGKKIGIADLFNGQAEIEHLIPFSKSLDDGRANKVLCTRQANRDKGNQTPYQAFGHSPGDYNWNEIFQRSKSLPLSKQWRFQENALEIWYRDHADFTERHLNDTRYIGRLAREYLCNICQSNRIDVLTGRLTAMLRGHWGLNSVLNERNQTQEKKKNRNDHRHHAVDAIVIGMTSRSMLQKVATAANHAEELDLGRLFCKSQIDPWDGFRDNVKKVVSGITVSHKPKRKPLDKNATDGQLHNDTAYGIISGPDDQGRFKVVVRKPIEAFEKRNDVESIRDKHLQCDFLQAFDDAVAEGGKGSDGVARLAKDRNIRHIRRTETLSIIPIRDKSGKVYKAYKGDSNWGMEIYEWPKDHEKAGKWEGVVHSRYEANQKDFRPGQTRKPHPAARLVMRLHVNDCIEIEKNELKQMQIMRLQKLSQGGNFSFAPHNEANVDARNRDGNDPFKYLSKTADALRQCNARKVHVSPTGQMSYEKRRKPRRKK